MNLIQELFSFCTDASMIPPMGLNNPAVITVTSTCSILTNANTCPMELERPSEVKSYEHFCNEMDLAITSQATGYGVAQTECDNKRHFSVP